MDHLDPTNHPNFSDSPPSNTLGVLVSAADIKRQTYMYAVPVLAVLSLIAVGANVAVLAIGRFIKSAHNCSTSITFTRGLAAADCWTSIIIATGLVLNSYLPYVHGIAPSLCISLVVESFRLGAIMTSVLFLLAIALNHRVITGRAHKSNTQWLNQPSTWALIVIMWLLPPIGFFLGFGSINGGLFHSGECGGGKEVLSGLPIRLTLFLLFAIPLLVMIIIYVQIVIRLRVMDKRFQPGGTSGNAEPREKRAASSDVTATTTERRTSFAVGRVQTQSSLVARNRKRMVTTALLIIGTFVFGWMPGSLFFLLSCDVCPFYYLDLPPQIAIMNGILITVPMILKGIINPVIYAQRIPEFREAFGILRRRTSNYSYTTMVSKASVGSLISPFRRMSNQAKQRAFKNRSAAAAAAAAEASMRDFEVELDGNGTEDGALWENCGKRKDRGLTTKNRYIETPVYEQEDQILL